MNWRSFILTLAIAFIVSLGLASRIGMAYSIPSGPTDDNFTIDVNKATVSPGEKVSFKISNGDNNRTALITVRNAMSSPKSGDVIFQTTASLPPGITDYAFTVPTDSKVYRYVFTVTDNNNPRSPDADNSKIFFTKDGGEKVVISDLQADTSRFTPGGKLPFSAKVLDGAGEPIPYVIISAVIRDQFGTGVVSKSFSVQKIAEEETIQYSPDGSIHGELALPTNFRSGNYSLELSSLSPIFGFTDYGSQKLSISTNENPSKTGGSASSDPSMLVTPLGIAAAAIGVVASIIVWKTKSSKQSARG